MDARQQRNIDQWPFSGENNASIQAANKTGLWIETNESAYDNLLGCLPPIRWIGNTFLVGEPDNYDFELKCNTYACLTIVNNRVFVKIVPIKTFNPDKYREEIIEQFEM